MTAKVDAECRPVKGVCRGTFTAVCQACRPSTGTGIGHPWVPVVQQIFSAAVYAFLWKISFMTTAMLPLPFNPRSKSVDSRHAKKSVNSRHR